MKVRMLQTIHPVFVPDGGGSQNHYYRDTAYDLVAEGAFVRIRVKDKTNGKVHGVPMANVACIEWAEDKLPEPKK